MKEELEEYFDKLWPLNRSLTGNGNRETFKILSEIIDLNVTEVPSGTSCFDWTVPPEWNVKEAWIKDSKGNIIVDFSVSNLHLLGYSISVHKKMKLIEFQENIYTLPDQPELVPYLTSYYKERWGFCMSYKQFLGLNQEEVYEVFIDSTLDINGSMTIADVVLKGSSEKEILFSTYICHPSLASNELSGPLVTAFIYRELKKIKNRYYSYRFVFVPETIGTIYYLSKYGNHLKSNLDAGYVITCIGDAGNFTYKRSRKEDSLANRCAEIILKQTEDHHNIEEFSPIGSDERQYCSPGFNLPVGVLMRTRFGKYPEYHTSADNKSFVSFEAMEKSVEKYLDIVRIFEKNFFYKNTSPFCEPQLGKRGLYPTLGSQKRTLDFVEKMMWILNLSDGTNDLIDMSEKSKLAVKELIPVINTLLKAGILSN